MASVFISHRGADQSAAERLGEALRERGHKVWIDTWKIDIGDSIVEQINAGLSDASFLLLCCSSEPSTSRWMDREWMSALARQLEGADVRVLPVVLTGGNLPPILSDVKYADLVTHWQDGIEAICKALG
jgi:predicted secreted hydrolase